MQKKIEKDKKKRFVMNIYEPTFCNRVKRGKNELGTKTNNIISSKNI